MGSLLELLGSISTIIFSFIRGATEEEIDKNIKFLTQYKWFQDYLDYESFARVIKEHEDVRRMIGTINIDKMKNNSRYTKKCKKRIHNALLKTMK